MAADRGPPKIIRYHTYFKNTILDVFRYRGWVAAENFTDWYHAQTRFPIFFPVLMSLGQWLLFLPGRDIMWHDRELIRNVLDEGHLVSHQRVNHFRNHYELTRKGTPC